MRYLSHRLVALSQAAETKESAGKRIFSLFLHGWFMPVADRELADLRFSTDTGNTPGALERGRASKRELCVERHHVSRLAPLAGGVKRLRAIHIINRFHSASAGLIFLGHSLSVRTPTPCAGPTFQPGIPGLETTPHTVPANQSAARP